MAIIGADEHSIMGGKIGILCVTLELCKLAYSGCGEHAFGSATTNIITAIASYSGDIVIA